MSQKNSLFVAGKELELYLDEKTINKLQNFVDSTSVMTTLMGYKTTVESTERSTYNNIWFYKDDDKAYGISFQNISGKTTCYCLRNWVPISITEFKKYIQEEM